jgi:hypothetical protein
MQVVAISARWNLSHILDLARIPILNTLKFAGVMVNCHNSITKTESAYPDFSSFFLRVICLNEQIGSATYCVFATALAT